MKSAPPSNSESLHMLGPSRVVGRWCGQGTSIVSWRIPGTWHVCVVWGARSVPHNGASLEAGYRSTSVDYECTSSAILHTIVLLLDLLHDHCCEASGPESPPSGGRPVVPRPLAFWCPSLTSSGASLTNRSDQLHALSADRGWASDSHEKCPVSDLLPSVCSSEYLRLGRGRGARWAWSRSQAQSGAQRPLGPQLVHFLDFSAVSSQELSGA